RSAVRRGGGACHGAMVDGSCVEHLLHRSDKQGRAAHLTLGNFVAHSRPAIVCSLPHHEGGSQIVTEHRGIPLPPMDELGGKHRLHGGMTPSRTTDALRFQCDLSCLKHGVITNGVSL